MYTQNIASALRLVTTGGRRRLIALVAGPLAGLAITLGTAAPSAAADTTFFGGNAVGISANAKAPPVVATLGRAALGLGGCDGTDGETRSNTVASVSVGTTLTTGLITTTAFTSRAGGTARLRDTATVSSLNLLGGLITATTLEAVAGLSADAAGITGSSAGSTLAALRVAGLPVAADVAPNTKLTLPGVGYVIVNEQVQGGTSQQRTILVRMLDVNVTTANVLGLAVGARIVVAQAYGVLGRTADEALVAGQAYAATVNAAIGSGLHVQIGALADLGLACKGTGGHTVTSSVGAVSVANVLALAAGQTTAFGGQTGAGTVAKTTATVTNLSLLNGLVRATAVTAVARETLHNGQRTRSTAGSGLVGLVVAGTPVSDTVAPNTKLTLPGVGYVIVNEQVVPGPSSTGATRVNGLHLFVTLSNALGLPVGGQIIVAHAHSATTTPSTG